MVVYTKEECALFKDNDAKISPKTFKPINQNSSNRIIKYCNKNFANNPCSNFICEYTRRDINPYNLKPFAKSKTAQDLKNSLLQKCMGITETDSCSCLYTTNQQRELKRICDEFAKNDTINPETGRKIKKNSKKYKELKLKCNMCSRMVDISRSTEETGIQISTETSENIDKVNELMRSIEEKNEELENINMKLSENEDTINNLKNNNYNLVDKLSSSEIKISQLENDLKECERILKSNVVLTESDYDVIKQKLSEYDDLKQIYEDSSNEYKNLSKKLRETLKLNKKYKEEVAKLKDEVKKFQINLKSIINESQAKDLLIQQYQLDIQKNMDQINNLELAMNSDENLSRIQELELENEAINSYIQAINLSLPRVNIDESELEGVEPYLIDLLRLRLKLDVIEQSEDVNLDKIDELSKQVDDLTEKIQRYNLIYQQQDEELDNLEFSKDYQIDELRKTLSRKIDELSFEINSLKEDSQSKDNKYKLLEQNYRKLQKDYENQIRLSKAMSEQLSRKK